MSPGHPAELNPETLLAECEVTRTRVGGPGGQRRNKVETAVRILHRATGVTAAAAERRSQVENQRVALFRLRVSLALQVRFDRRATEPSPLWRSRCRKGNIVLNPNHDDFPAILAEVLDILANLSWQTKSAAEELECTSSQMIKLLKAEPRAMVYVNQNRSELGLHPLR